MRGPLNIPRSLQGWPVVVQAGASEAGRKHAAETAEVVFAAGELIERSTRLLCRREGPCGEDRPQPRSGKLATELDRLDLIDEYRFLVHPRIAGHGPTLYHTGLPSTRRLELISGEPTPPRRGRHKLPARALMLPHLASTARPGAKNGARRADEDPGRPLCHGATSREGGMAGGSPTKTRPKLWQAYLLALGLIAGCGGSKSRDDPDGSVETSFRKRFTNPWRGPAPHYNAGSFHLTGQVHGRERAELDPRSGSSWAASRTGDDAATAATLAALGAAHEVRVVSAHRTPLRLHRTTPRRRAPRA